MNRAMNISISMLDSIKIKRELSIKTLTKVERILRVVFRELYIKRTLLRRKDLTQYRVLMVLSLEQLMEEILKMVYLELVLQCLLLLYLIHKIQIHQA